MRGDYWRGSVYREKYGVKCSYTVDQHGIMDIRSDLKIKTMDLEGLFESSRLKFLGL